MKKSDIRQKPSYYDRYINLVEDIELDQALQNGLTEMASLDLNLLKRIGKKTYAADKWSINEIIQHLIDHAVPANHVMGANLSFWCNERF